MSSNDQNTRLILSFLKDSADSINEYINEALKREYISFSSEEELIQYFNDYINSLYNRLTFKEMEDIKYYTGYNWNYEVNGHIDRKKEYESVCKSIEESFCKSLELPGDIISYRGIDLSPFRSYGINNISDLVNMKDEFMYESGLTSTSLIKNTSFFDKELGNHSECNILIEYYIPKECSDGIPLITDELSYSTSQNEFLLMPGTLCKVIDVETLDNGNKAIIKVSYIPSKIWDPNRKEQFEDKKVI